MYIIEEGKAYFVEGDKAYLVNFGASKSEISKDDFIEVEKQPQYTYDEVYRKLNVAYFLKQEENKEKIKEFNSAEFEAYEKEIEALNAENEDLKKEIEALNAEIEALKGAPIVDKSKESKTEEPLKEPSKK